MDKYTSPQKRQQFSRFKHGVREWGISKNKNVGREGGKVKPKQYKTNTYLMLK